MRSQSTADVVSNSREVILLAACFALPVGFGPCPGVKYHEMNGF